MGHNEGDAKRLVPNVNCPYKKLERSYTSNLTLHRVALKTDRITTPKRSLCKGTIKLRCEINSIETNNST